MRSFPMAPALGALCAFAFLGSSAEAAPMTFSNPDVSFVTASSRDFRMSSSSQVSYSLSVSSARGDALQTNAGAGYAASPGTIVASDGKLTLVTGAGAVSGTAVQTLFNSSITGADIVTEIKVTSSTVKGIAAGTLLGVDLHVWNLDSMGNGLVTGDVAVIKPGGAPSPSPAPGPGSGGSQVPEPASLSLLLLGLGALGGAARKRRG